VAEDTTQADQRYQAWLRRYLDRAANHFGLTLVEEPTFGWRLRSLSGPAQSPAGPRWLRVVTEDHRWLPADFWTGNTDANVITAVPRPRVLDWTEWSDSEWRRQVRAEVMAMAPGWPCSATDVLRTPLTLPNAWWHDLRHGLEVIRSTTTSRHGVTAEQVKTRVHAVFDVDLPVNRWETVHGDLHWSNLLMPDFGLLDWELWGSGPAGYDEATLYLFSLLIPDTARRVNEVFRDVLDSPDGRQAQVFVAARILSRAQQGENSDLAQVVREHIQPIVDTAAL
jgi:hypothetical protein